MKNNLFRIGRRISKKIKVLPDFFVLFLYEFFSVSENKFFLFIRYILVASLVESIGLNVYIGKNVTLKNLKNISIGNNVSIHNNCYIDGYGGIYIGNDVSIAHNSSIMSSTHRWSNNELAIKYNPVEKMPIFIGNDVWIGMGVRILNGIKIEDRSIIGANSVVNKDVPSNTVVAGVPIKKIKEIDY